MERYCRHLFQGYLFPMLNLPFKAIRLWFFIAAVFSLSACNMNVGSLGDISAKRMAHIDLQPSIRSIAPTSGSREGGTLLTIDGKNFEPGLEVTVGGKSCTIVDVVTDEVIRCVTSPGSEGAQDVVVTNPNGLSHTLAGAFTFIEIKDSLPPPQVSSINPTSGPSDGGTFVAIKGKDFVDALEVRIGGVNCGSVLLVSSTELTCVTGKNDLGTRTLAVVVINSDLQAGAIDQAFTYYDAPKVTSIDPAFGPPSGGNEVTISGSDFRIGIIINIDGPCGQVNVLSSSQLSCRIEAKAHALTEFPVTATNDDGQSGSLPNAYSFYNAPNVAFSQILSSAAENAGTINVEVRLFSPAAKQVTLNYSIAASSTATAGAANDYSHTVAPLVFAIGEQNKNLSFTIQTDNSDEPDETIVINLTSATYAVLGANIQHTLTILDQNTSLVLVSPTSLSINEGANKTFIVALNTKPNADVAIAIASSDATEAPVSPSSLTFTATNWNAPQTVTVNALDDLMVDGDQTALAQITVASSLDLNYASLNPDDVSLSIVDMNIPGATSNPTSLTINEKANGNFTIALNTKPSAAVTIAIASSDATEASISPTSLTFTTTNWNVPQDVTVSALDDQTTDGNQSATAQITVSSSADTNYSAYNPPDVSLTIVDMNIPGVTSNPTSLTINEKVSQTFTVGLDTQPSANVVIAVTSSDTTEASVSPTSLTFTSANWNAPQTVTVSALDDQTTDGNQSATAQITVSSSSDTNYSSLNPNDVSLSIVDTNVPGVAINPSSLTINERANQTFTVVLNTRPNANVVIAVASSDATEASASPTSLTFTTTDWNAPQTVAVTALDDLMIDGNQTALASITVSSSSDSNYASIDPDDVSLSIVDTNVPGSTANPTSLSINEGVSKTFTLALDTKPSSDVVIAIASSDATEASVSPTSLTFTTNNWNTTQTVTVNALNDSTVDGNQTALAQITVSSSSDTNYSSFNPPDVSLTINDMNVPGVTVTPTSLIINEEASKTFTVALNTIPSANVVIAVSSSDATEASVNPTSLTFTSANWNTVQTVTVTSPDDLMVDGNQTALAQITVSSSSDTNYSAYNPDDVSLTIVDINIPGVTVSPTSLTINEKASQTFTVVLNTQPSATVFIAVASSDATEASVNPTSLTFTTTDWNAPQTVTINGLDDLIMDGNQTATAQITVFSSSDPNYSSFNPTDVSLTIVDTNIPGVTLNPASLTINEGANQAFTVVLNTQPSTDVVISVASSDLTEASVFPFLLTFTSGNWNAPQTVTVSAPNDYSIDGNQTATALLILSSTDSDYAVIDPPDVSLTIVDMNVPGVTFNPASLTINEGANDTFTVVLNTQPSADVVIAIASSDSMEASVSPSLLTFTTGNWDSTQTVIVTASDDLMVDGNQSITAVITVSSSTDTNYASYNPPDVSLSIVDMNVPGVTVSPAHLSINEGASKTFTVALNTQPSANVVIAVSSSDATEASVSPTALTFTSINWNTSQTVTVNALNDNLVDGNQSAIAQITVSSSSDTNYSSYNPPDVSLTIVDMNVPGVTVNPISLSINEGATGTFTVALNTIPSADVVIAIASSDATEASVSPTALTFTSANWNTAQTVTVHALNDQIMDGNQSATALITVSSSSDTSYASLNPDDVGLSIADTNTAGVTVNPASLTINEGDNNTFTIILNTQPFSDVVIAVASSDSSEASVSPASLTFTSVNWNTAQTVTVNAVDDSLVDGDQSASAQITIASSSDPNYSSYNPADVSLTVVDMNGPGVTLNPTSLSINEGTTGTFTMALNTIPNADVVIAVASSDATEASVSPTSLTFTPANWNTAQTVTVSGLNDNTVDGNQSATAVITVSSSADPNYLSYNPPDVSLTINDTNLPGMTVSPSSLTINEGANSTFNLKLNTIPSANVVIAVASSDATEASVSPTSLTFTPANWNTDQTVTVSGLNDTAVDGNQTATAVITVSSSADTNYSSYNPPDVSLSVVDIDVVGSTVTPTSLTINEGATGTFTVALNTIPSADVVVSITSSDATEASVSPTALTFTTANWNTNQTVTVSGLNDNTIDGNQSATAVITVSSSTDPNYSSYNPLDVSLTINDTNVPGASVTPTTLSVNESATGIFTIALNTIPSANVVIAIASSDATEASVSPTSLTFTTANWNTNQTVTVSGLNDNTIDGSQSATAVITVSSSTDPNYSSYNPPDVSLTINDTNVPGASVTPTTLSVNESATGIFTIALNTIPSANVVIAIASSDATEASVRPTSLTFTPANWNTNQTVTVSGLNDNTIDGNQSATAVITVSSSTDPNYSSYNPPDVSLTINDIDVAGATISPTSLSINEGAIDTFTVALNTIPSANVVIGIASSDVTEASVVTGAWVGPTTLTFTPADWSTAQTVTVIGLHDNTIDGNQSASAVITVSSSTDPNYSSYNPPDVRLTINDTDVAGATISPTSLSINEGAIDTFTVALNTIPSANVVIGIASSDATEASVGPTSLTFTPANWNTAQTVTVSGLNDNTIDGNQSTTAVITVSSSTDTNYASYNPPDVSLTINDTNVRGVTINPTSLSINEGAIDTFTVALNTIPSANVVIGIASSDVTEALVSLTSLTFTPADWSTAQTVTVFGLHDNTIDGDQSASAVITVSSSTDTNYSSYNPPDVSLTIIDTTLPPGTTISLSLNEGATDTFTVKLDTVPSADVVIGIASSDATEASVSPTSLTFTPANWSTAQTVTVFGLHDNTIDGNQSATVLITVSSSTDPRYSSYDPPDVSLTINDIDVAGATISPTSLSINEGAIDTFTVALNTIPSANVVVDIASSDATEASVSPTSLTFTPANWNAAQTVTVSGLHDNTVDGNQAATALITVSSSTDTNYSSYNPPDVGLTIVDRNTTPPSIISISPAIGSETGLDPITILGANFVSGATVDFGGSPCTVTSTISTDIRCATSSHVPAQVNVTVTNPDGTLGSVSGGFTYMEGGSWQATSTTGAPEGRFNHPAVWTGSEMIVWGGNNGTGYLNTGGSYNPLTNSWSTVTTSGAPTARDDHGAVWTGTEMIIWGGKDSSAVNTGGRYNPVSNSWIATQTSGAPAARSIPTTVFTGNEMIIWGGLDGGTGLNTGSRYDVALNTWNNTSSSSLSGRFNHTAVWTGTEMIIWGGQYSALNDGARYTPTTDTWTTTNTATTPQGRYLHNAVWAGDEMIVWGGHNGLLKINTGAKYNPTSNSWTAITQTNAPEARYLFASIWTGTEMIIWGGSGNITNLNSGGRYNPSTNSWSPMASLNAPGTRIDHTAIWTGSQMLIFGGGTAPTNTGSRYMPPLPAPTLSSVFPDGGSPSGGTQVTITGTNFFYGAAVLFDSSDCTQVNVVSNTQITCRTPSHLAGGVAVKVTNIDGKNITQNSAFTYRAAPTVLTINPTSGPTGGGTLVTITGSGFLPNARVIIAGYDCTNVGVQSPVEIWATTGNANTLPTGQYNVVVRNTDLQEGILSSGFTYNHAPDVVGISPNTGRSAGGQSVTISGTDFWTSTVLIGTSPCDVTSSTPLSIVCTTGLNTSGTAAYTVKVTNGDGQWDSLPIGFIYTNPPMVSSISPLAGPLGGGNSITISGADFRSGATAKLGAANCTSPSVLNVSTLTCLAPAGTGTVTAQVTNTDDGQISTGGSYTYQPAPTVSSVTPATVEVSVATQVTITGTNFLTGITASLGASACTSPVRIDSNNMRCTAPALAQGQYNVTVLNTDSQSGVGSGLLKSEYKPVVSTVNPTSGPASGGQSITIGGGYFKSGATVAIGSTACDVTDIPFASFIICRTRAAAPALNTITVTNHPDEFSGSKASAYTYIAAPNIFSIFPTTGPRSGGTPVTISGTSFTSTTLVSIGGLTCDVTGRAIPNEIYCTTRAQNPGPYDVLVFDEYMQSDTLPGGYTYTNSGIWAATNTSAPVGRSAHTAVWTGSEMIVWGGANNTDPYQTDTGGRYDPITDSWWSIPGGGTGPSRRKNHTAVWTGREMIIWGGLVTSPANLALSDVGRYDPTSNTWINISIIGTCLKRYKHTAIWTGREMVVWGGRTEGSTYYNTGCRFYPDPVSPRWAPVSTTNAPRERNEQTAVWTGKEMIIWGGRDGPDYLNTGGRWTPSSTGGTGTWATLPTTNAPTGRWGHSAVWTGNRMIIYGGWTSTGITWTGKHWVWVDPRRPANNNTWQNMSSESFPEAIYLHTAVWTGTKMLVFGGYTSTGSTESNRLLMHDPYGTEPTSSSGTTVSLADTGKPSIRQGHTAVWTGKEMIIWGGYQSMGIVYLNNGGRYTPPLNEPLSTNDTWQPIADLALFAPEYNERYRHQSVWTGSEMLVWGGKHYGPEHYVRNGARYDPVTNSWTAMTSTNQPDGRWHFTAIWTGIHMIVWGGYNEPEVTLQLNTGGQYDPIANTWTATNIADPDLPSARERHTAVWTGREMIIWGGRGVGNTLLGDGARFIPYATGPYVANTWEPMVAPFAGFGTRELHTATWTGRHMIVWGGIGYGSGCDGGTCSLGAYYDPWTNGWTESFAGFGNASSRAYHTSIWTGKYLIIWGGGTNCGVLCSTSFNDGIIYEPYKPGTTSHTERYYRIYDGAPEQLTVAPSPRALHRAVWTGDKMIVWGGGGSDFPEEGGKLSQAYYNSTSGRMVWRWDATTTTGAPNGRWDHTAIWTGLEMIIFGGYSDIGGVEVSGFKYKP